jgi:hypothetical protein
MAEMPLAGERDDEFKLLDHDGRLMDRTYLRKKPRQAP